MKKIYLKTSKFNIDEEKKINDLIYLGDWCYDLEKKLKIDSNYYLKTQDNKEEVFKILFSLKDKLILSLKNFLNNLHNVDKDIKYWNFLIGPWLIGFLHVIYDRWQVFENNKDILKSKNIYTFIGKILNENIIPKEMHTGRHFFYQDLWNHYIFGEIIKYKKNIKFDQIDIKQENLNILLAKKKNLNLKINNYFKYFLKFANFFYKKNKLNKIIFLTDIHYLFQIKTYLRFKQFPTFVPPPADYKNNQINDEIRAKRLNFLTASELEEFLSINLLKFIPKSVLENYHEIINENLHYYEKFKSKNYFISQLETPDRIKFFIADQTNSKKIIYQHGGCYGLMKFHFREILEVQLSDYFLTFGWNKYNCHELLSEKEKNKIVDFYPIHLSNKSIDTKKNTMNYLILDEFPNYFLENVSNYDSHTYRLYFKNIIKFIENLDYKFKENLLIRIHPARLLKETYNILKTKFPKITIDDGSQDIMKNISKSKLCIIGNNSTTFLQTLRMNVPTILFWDENIIQTRDNCKKYIKLLYDSGIFYKNADTAAIFCNKNQNIYEWWNEKERKEKISIFLNDFANKNEKKIVKLFSIIENKYNEKKN